MKKALLLAIALAVVPSVLLIAARPAAPQSAASMKKSRTFQFNSPYEDGR